MESAENQEQQPQANQPEAASNDVSSLSKTETIKLLNDSIDRLEATIKGIKENNSKKLPSSDSIDTLVTTTQKLAETVTSPPSTVDIESNSSVSSTPATVNVEPTPSVPETPETSVKPEPAPSETKTDPTATTTATATKPPTIKQLKQQTGRKKLKQPNMGLIITGIIALVIAIAAIVWFWLQPEEINFASSPPATEIITNNETNPKPEVVNPPAINPETNTDTPKPEVVNPPVINPETNTDSPKSDKIVVKNPSATPETTDSEADAPTTIPIPPDLTSPGRAKNLKIVTIEPELTFTPEQTLVAALQGKIADLINKDEADIVNFIKVDLPTSSLVVEMKDNWYELNESRQNKLANEILQRSRKLNFSKLELKDSQGTLVARNPVIGEQIIILQGNKDNKQLTDNQ
ncbi:MAG: hypothetical protein ACRC80_33780 [Waterburya sp.]